MVQQGCQKSPTRPKGSPRPFFFCGFSLNILGWFSFFAQGPPCSAPTDARGAPFFPWQKWVKNFGGANDFFWLCSGVGDSPNKSQKATFGFFLLVFFCVFLGRTSDPNIESTVHSDSKSAKKNRKFFAFISAPHTPLPTPLPPHSHIPQTKTPHPSLRLASGGADLCNVLRQYFALYTVHSLPKPTIPTS